MTNTTELNSMTPRHRYFIFFNIGIQIVFPLSLSFTPSILAHATENRTKFLLLPETKVYTLGLGDTPAGIAKQQGITLEQLKKLNQFRTFSKPFEELSIGDEIDIPGGSEPVKTVGTEITGTETAGNSAGIAQTALQAGHFLQNNPGRDAAKDLARSVAVGEINTQTNNEVTEWLQGKGKARVKFDVDNDFTLKNSQLDILVPLWELPEHMVFSQASLHRTESRTQSNLGLGYRFFASEYMLGVNTFYDHDWSRSHSRVGLGAEYQRDFMKLSANGYFRTSDWKDSRDVQFYEERPADGWDLRAEGYLPAYPEIGGKLVYEKYYGDSVGLFGKDNQQKNPYAVTVGANYSPFPLLTFNAEQRQGKSGENDTRFGIDLNYTFGVPMLQQLDSHQLLASRLLQSNRYDFVDRNNHIILEYRKKETISVSLPAQVSGYTGEKRTLNLSVNSRHGVSHVEWSAPELLAHGGQITREGMTQYSVILPDYQYGKGAVNHYTVSVIAYDESGNPSRQASTQVLVTSAAVSPAGSILSPSEILLPNDGKSTEQLILKLQNTDNQPVTGVAADILMSVKSLSGSQSDVTVSKFTEATDNPGTYYATVTAGISSGEFLLTPKIQNISIASAKAIIGRAPAVSELMITGKLALGETLTGTYKFNANGSNNEDRSRYQWGNEGKTSSLNQSETVITSGSIPGYILVKEDIGKIKSLSLQARNALNTAGNTETVTTVPGSTGNGTDGGNNGSITDETGAPAISQVAISGTLSVGQTLRGSYTFDAQTGNPQDSSVAAWGERGSTEAAVSGGHGTAT
ncbi:inverse autotransporter beta domain-containing protein, partial [Morganella psychrotolerans]